MAKAYSLDLRDKVISFISQGESKRQSSKVFGIGEDTIYRWLRRHKAGTLAPKKRTHFPQKVVPEILVSYVEENQDHTLKEIGKALGFSASNVLKWLRRLNITRKKRPRSIRNVVRKSGLISKRN